MLTFWDVFADVNVKPNTESLWVKGTMYCIHELLSLSFFYSGDKIFFCMVGSGEKDFTVRI